MRITGGAARGIQIKAPKGNATRPATDRLREAIFSSLGASIEGCKVADLFAGTGSYGLEALSRGAASSTFFETDHAALTCLRQNVQAAIRSCNLDTGVAKVVARDVFTLDSTTPSYDLIFLDPPYDTIAENLHRIFEKRSTRSPLKTLASSSSYQGTWSLKSRTGRFCAELVRLGKTSLRH